RSIRPRSPTSAFEAVPPHRGSAPVAVQRSGGQGGAAHAAGARDPRTRRGGKDERRCGELVVDLARHRSQASRERLRQTRRPYARGSCGCALAAPSSGTGGRGTAGPYCRAEGHAGGDRARSLRAALAIRGRLVEVNERLAATHGVTMEIRTGINTGEAVAALDAAPGEAIVTGVAVNTAARLEQLAEPGQTVVAERTV